MSRLHFNQPMPEAGGVTEAENHLENAREPFR